MNPMILKVPKQEESRIPMATRFFEQPGFADRFKVEVLDKLTPEDLIE
jgi:hypothetical protein